MAKSEPQIARLEVQFVYDDGLEVRTFNFQDNDSFSKTVSEAKPDAACVFGGQGFDGLMAYLGVFVLCAAKSTDGKTAAVDSDKWPGKNVRDLHNQKALAWRKRLFGPQWGMLVKPVGAKVYLKHDFLKCSEMKFWLGGQPLTDAHGLNDLAKKIGVQLTKNIEEPPGGDNDAVLIARDACGPVRSLASDGSKSEDVLCRLRAFIEQARNAFEQAQETGSFEFGEQALRRWKVGVLRYLAANVSGEEARSFLKLKTSRPAASDMEHLESSFHHHLVFLERLLCASDTGHGFTTTPDASPGTNHSLNFESFTYGQWPLADPKTALPSKKPEPVASDYTHGDWITAAIVGPERAETVLKSLAAELVFLDNEPRADALSWICERLAWEIEQLKERFHQGGQTNEKRLDACMAKAVADTLERELNEFLWEVEERGQDHPLQVFRQVIRTFVAREQARPDKKPSANSVSSEAGQRTPNVVGSRTAGLPDTELVEEAALLLLGFWHGEFGTYLVYWRDEFEVSGIPKEESQAFFRSRMEEAWSKLEESMGRSKLSVTRNAIEEDRTNPMMVLEDQQKRVYRAVARRFSTEKARIFLYGDLLGGELLWCENLSRGMKKKDTFAKLWEMKLSQVTAFAPMLNLPEEEELLQSVRTLIQNGSDDRTLLDVEQACRERIVGRCEELVLAY